MQPLSLDPDQPRRDFLKKLSAASIAALMARAPRASAETIVQPTATADACILLWMGGGMAAPETFDPKAYQPFVKGAPVAKMLSTFPAIDTSVDNIKICQGLEQIAKVMDRATLIRSAVQPDLGTILHSRHQYHWHTGYVPPQTVAAPHIGAWMAKVLGPRNPVMPAFINIGQRLEGVGESEELKAFTTGGFFGSEYGPIARLILDLEERKLLDRTLVVIASEFSRDALIEGVPGSKASDQTRFKSDTLEESKHYGLHRHFTGGTSVVMFGGGVKKGFVYGATADERPLIAIKNPVNISDLHATIFAAMGISPKTMYEIEQRPFYATLDGLGKPVTDIFA